jgi:hypothetical protein
MTKIVESEGRLPRGVEEYWQSRRCWESRVDRLE